MLERIATKACSKAILTWNGKLLGSTLVSFPILVSETTRETGRRTHTTMMIYDEREAQKPYPIVCRFACALANAALRERKTLLDVSVSNSRPSLQARTFWSRKRRPSYFIFVKHAYYHKSAVWLRCARKTIVVRDLKGFSYHQSRNLRRLVTPMVRGDKRGTLYE